ncbi:hypothetical protein BDY24DRAFT_375038 [Mrakia frigida]|uniref:uncharacterized protein n=1 Tax=Mrakia frigida TaxID=29902 RepID=UPI003FCC108A
MDLEELQELQDSAAEYQAATTNLLSSDLSQLFEQNRKLESSLASLSNHVAFQFATLKKENQDLRYVVEAQDQAIGDLSKELNPSGYWVWARGREGREEGRWRWSLKNGLSSISSLLAHRQPPTLLLPSLPVELLSEITTYLEHEDKLDLALVCFRFFDLLAHELYSRVNLYADDARKFAAAKFTSTTIHSPRLARLRTMEQVVLFDPSAHASRVTFEPSSASSPLAVDDLQVVTTNLATDLQLFSPLLRHLHPVDRFVLFFPNNHDHGLPPSVVRVPSSSLFDFAEQWTKPRRVELDGPGTVPFVEGEEGEFTLSIGGSKPDRFWFWTEHQDGTTTEEEAFLLDELRERVESNIIIPRIEKGVTLACVWT